MEEGGGESQMRVPKKRIGLVGIKRSKSCASCLPMEVNQPGTGNNVLKRQNRSSSIQSSVRRQRYGDGDGIFKIDC